MNDKVKQIFEILGVEPGGEFKINSSSSFYKLNSDLKLFVTGDRERWFLSDFSIGDIISYGIIKIPQKPKLTNKDKVAIKFLKNCGFHYVVESEINASLFAFENMPDKIMTVDGNTIWAANSISRHFPTNVFDMPIDDKKPLCLDDFSDEDLKEI